MTSKEKAKELISKFTFLSLPESDAKFYNPKQCSLIWFLQAKLSYWMEVKQEIEKLRKKRNETNN